MMKRYMQGELSSASEAKRPNDKMEIDPNQKVVQGSLAAGEHPKTKSKSGVDQSLLRMADERDY